MDSLGNPLYIGAGQSYLRAYPGQNGIGHSMFDGCLVLKRGSTADIRVVSVTFIPNDQNTAEQPLSSCSSSAQLTNSTRVYQMPSNPQRGRGPHLLHRKGCRQQTKKYPPVARSPDRRQHLLPYHPQLKEG